MSATANCEAQRVILDLPGTPFHGLTEEKAWMINNVLCGRRVFVTGTQKSYNRALDGKKMAGPPALSEEYMFYRLLTPGSVKTDPFSEVYDIELFKYYPGGHFAAGGSKRIISPSLVTCFEVVEAP